MSLAQTSPAILYTMIILAAIFFIYGLVHLLIRFLIRKTSSNSNPISESGNSISNSDTFQRQLQTLFQLHDSGLDQAFIDALPLFQYKEIIGLKEPFDCAVCLCEFLEQDKLRLLPLCSHAFHIDCIDTWLLSNSTCPLCRGALYAPGFGFDNPVFGFDDSREDDGKTKNPFEIDIGGGVKKVFPVRLGKFRSTNNVVSQEVVLAAKERDLCETSCSNLDARRCYSMGSYQYVVAESALKVSLSPDAGFKKLNLRNVNLASSKTTAILNVDAEARKINVGGKNESLSVSKIWLWNKKSKFSNSSNANFNVDVSLPWTNKDQVS